MTVQTLETPTFEHAETRELVDLVDDAAALIDLMGETAFPELRIEGSRWRQGETYVFVLDGNGNALVHPDPTQEGRNLLHLKDVVGRPVIQGLIDSVAVPGRLTGWVHYQWPAPGSPVPRWKSTYVRFVRMPSGASCIVGSGSDSGRMERALVEEIVDRAADLISRRGRDAFPQLRDKRGPFLFRDTYVFVQTPDGTELVNPAQPELEGKNLMDVRDLKGNTIVRDEIAAALRDGSAWLECYWNRPTDNKPALKQTYVRRVQFGAETFIVGSGLYAD